MKKPLLTLSLLLAFGAANAGTIANSSVTILPTSSAAFSGYGQANALDSSFSSDFASAGLAASTHLDFYFGSAFSFSQIQYTDRTSSGNINNSNFFGTFDYVTKYQYVFSNNASFSDIVGTVTKDVTVPTLPSLTSFTHTDAIPSITAQYVRWQVLATNGANPGAANFQFTATPVPEPEIYAMLLAGLGLMGTIARRRKSQKL